MWVPALRDLADNLHDLNLTEKFIFPGSEPVNNADNPL